MDKSVQIIRDIVKIHSNNVDQLESLGFLKVVEDSKSYDGYNLKFPDSNVPDSRVFSITRSKIPQIDTLRKRLKETLTSSGHRMMAATCNGALLNYMDFCKGKNNVGQDLTAKKAFMFQTRCMLRLCKAADKLEKTGNYDEACYYILDEAYSNSEDNGIFESVIIN